MMAELNKSILIVDDNPSNLKVLSLILKSQGYNVRVATNGAQAIESVNLELPDLILMDIQMPEINGYDTCRRLKSIEKFSHIPVIFISAMSEDFNKELAYAAGGVDYIVKPFQNKEVIARVKTQILLQEQTRKLELLNLELVKRLEHTFEQAPVGFAYLSYENYRFLTANKVLCQLLNISSPIELEQTSIYKFIDKSDADFFESKIKSIVKHGGVLKEEVQLNLPGNQRLWVKISLSVIHVKKNESEPYLFLILEDIDVKKNAISQIQKLSKAIEQSPVGVIITHPNGSIEYANPSFCKFSGYEKEEVIGQNPNIIKSGKHTDEFYNSMWSVLNAGQIWKGEIQNKSKNGQYFWVNATISPVLDKKGNITNFIGIQEDSTLKREYIDGLEVAKQKAENNERLKSAFIANMSHEIRTPMNGLLGFLDLLKEPDLETIQKESFIPTIKQSSERLLRTLNNILDMSQASLEHLKLTVSNLDLSVLLEELIEQFTDKAKTKNLKIKSEFIFPENTKVSVDVEKLRLILENLLDNAIRFTNSGEVAFGCYFENDIVHIYVQDTGIGIRPENLNFIFEKFAQENIAMNRGHEGLGLGLTFCKIYSQLMGGDIYVESEIGKGSRFEFTFKNVMTIDNGQEKENKHMNMTPKKVLIAEDEDDSYALLELLLSEFQIEIVRAKNGRHALEEFNAEKKWSLILMDIKMPFMSGYDVVGKIRSVDPHVPILAQSAHVLDGDKEKAVMAGCNGYITKPIVKSEFLALAKEYL